MNLSPFYARTAEIPDADQLITQIIKAHRTAKREGLLCLEFCADQYAPELTFFFDKLELPFPVFDEIAYIRFCQVSRHPLVLSRCLLAYRAAKGIMMAEDIFSLLAVLKVIIRKDELDLELDPASGEEIDSMLWRGTEVIHFSDLMRCEDRHLQMLLRELSTEDTASAFSRASPELRGRMLDQCSKGVQSDLRLRMYIGASEDKCRLSQEKWLEVLGKLVDAGEIEI